MIQFIKLSDDPLTFEITYEKELPATYNVESITCIPKVETNTADIIIKVIQTVISPAKFKHTFEQVFSELDSNKKVTINIITLDENDNDITHQESADFVERPFKKPS